MFIGVYILCFTIIKKKHCSVFFLWNLSFVSLNDFKYFIIRLIALPIYISHDRRICEHQYLLTRKAEVATFKIVLLFMFTPSFMLKSEHLGIIIQPHLSSSVEWVLGQKYKLSHKDARLFCHYFNSIFFAYTYV